MFGGKGRDRLLGKSGNDLLDGGSGNDQLSGGAGDDTILGNTGNDTLKGQRGDDLLFGGDGNDDLKGGDGNDALHGFTSSAGGSNIERDRLTGGAGTDRFILGQASTGYANAGSDDFALIRDFTDGADVIQLAGTISAYALESASTQSISQTVRDSLGLSLSDLAQSTAIVLQSTSTSAELIGIVQNVTPENLDLLSSDFSFTG